MLDGVETLLEPQLCYLPRGMHGSPDILERREGDSALGGFHYIVKEIKSSKRIRRKHILQAAFYNTMMGHIQQYTPKEFYLLNVAGEESEYQHEEYADEISCIMSEVTSIMDGQMPRVSYGRGIFPWSVYSDKMAVENDDLSLVSGMESQDRRRLESVGLTTVSALADAGVVPGMTQARRHVLIGRARSLKTGRAIRLEPPACVPDTTTNVFLRLEEGLNSEVYMTGVLVVSTDDIQYVSFTHDDGIDAMLKGVTRHLRDLPEHTTYYWGSGGDTPIRVLARHCNQESSDVDMPMMDLQTLSSSILAFPTYRMKLKLVAEWTGFEWTDPQSDWGSAYAMYQQYAAGVARQKCLKYIRTYNHDNCLAIRAVWQWMIRAGHLVPKSGLEGLRSPDL